MENLKFEPDLNWLRSRLGNAGHAVSTRATEQLADAGCDLLDILNLYENGKFQYVDFEYGGYLFRLEGRSCEDGPICYVGYFFDADDFVEVIDVFRK